MVVVYSKILKSRVFHSRSNPTQITNSKAKHPKQTIDIFFFWIGVVLDLYFEVLIQTNLCALLHEVVHKNT